jgi:hypothetical protein
MSHHKQILIDGKLLGHVVITNLGQVLSIVIHQPWGDIEIFRSQHEEIHEEE